MKEREKREGGNERIEEKKEEKGKPTEKEE